MEEKTFFPGFLVQWFLKYSSWTIASASPGHSLEMQILRPTPKPTESEPLVLGASKLVILMLAIV